jgi:hypothetical protein
MLLGGGGLLGFLASLITTRATRAHDRVTEKQGQFQNDLEMRKYVDSVVKASVDAATAPLNDQIAARDRQIAALNEQIRAQDLQILKRDEVIEKFGAKDRIMSWFVQRLYWWDDRGRTGPMPRLTFDEQNALDLDLFPEDTRSPIDQTPTLPPAESDPARP